MHRPSNAAGPVPRAAMLRSSPKEPYEAARLVPAPALAAGGAGARAGRDQPDLLAARPADLPLRHRRVRDPLLRSTRPASSSAASACCWRRRSASPSCRAWPRTSRTTSSTSSPSGSARSSTPTASATRCELPYAVFEDQRSGETLGKLQKVRTDVERLISVVDQRAVHVARRRRLRDDLRLHASTGSSRPSTSSPCRCSAS